MKFVVDNLEYKITFSNNEWVLSLINKPVGTNYIIKKDFFFYGDENEEHMDDVNVKTNVFKLADYVINIVCSKMSNDKPNFFFFKPSTKRKKKIYKRFAKKLESELNGLYKFSVNGSYFYFFKN